MVASLLIFFRESLEASMICSIMLAYLAHAGRRDRFRAVWYGVALAALGAMVGGVVIFHTIRTYDGSGLQNIIEGVTYFVACGVLTYMTFWMKRQSRNLKSELHARMDAAIRTGSALAMGMIAFLTVGREGLETVVFMIAIAFRTQAVWMALGAGLGMVAGLGLSYMIYVLGRRISLKRFFDAMGILLMLFAAGLLADGIQAFQELGWLPFGQHAMWHTATLLSENSTFGDILHSFLGYADSPTSLQIAVYLGYLLVVLTFFMRSTAKAPYLRGRPD